MVKQALEQAGWQMDDVDAFVFHQANRFILNHLVKRMKIASDKVPLSIDIFGNTSSASIPITMTERLSDTLKTQSMKLVLAGFGVGLSWAAATVECGPIVISDLVSVSGA
jgi:3-oxoacyl-[acyl-carrier-protein] synthase-3